MSLWVGLEFVIFTKGPFKVSGINIIWYCNKFFTHDGNIRTMQRNFGGLTTRLELECSGAVDNPKQNNQRVTLLDSIAPDLQHSKRPSWCLQTRESTSTQACAYVVPGPTRSVFFSFRGEAEAQEAFTWTNHSTSPVSSLFPYCGGYST